MSQSLAAYTQVHTYQALKNQEFGSRVDASDAQQAIEERLLKEELARTTSPRAIQV